MVHNTLRPWLIVCAALLAAGLLLFSSPPSNAAAPPRPASLEPGFEQYVKPFLNQNCVKCHNADQPTAGVRVDHLNATLEDRHVATWENIRHRVAEGTMPPKGLPRPDQAANARVLEWIAGAVETAKLRPAPKNGLVRRLTVAQYRNTLRELLKLEDDLTEILPPDAISKDGFVNNRETLQLSPLLMEAYLEIAEEALSRAMVDPAAKPAIQNFRMDLGASVNPNPSPDALVLGANSLLLDNKDVLVTQLTARKPFAFDPFFMRTKYRFIEGYQGNDTVRGWREYDSIYHSVFACMRGSRGYPKGAAFSTVPEGLLLRPAIPNDEIFNDDGTYGPKANFKISLRELPDNGRFRVTVTAARYDDGLLLDKGTSPRAQDGFAKPGFEARFRAGDTITIPKPGVYQVDLYEAARSNAAPVIDGTRLSEGLGASLSFDNAMEGRGTGEAKLVESPFGKAISLDGMGDSVAVPRTAAMNVGTGDFTVAAWINPGALKRGGILAMGGHDWTHGWYLEMPGNRGDLRFDTASADNQSNGAITSPAGMIKANAWQHVSVVVRRGGESRIYVNGFPVAKGEIAAASLDNPKMDLHVGRIPGAQHFQGQIDSVRLYNRALGDAELQALIEPGRKFAVAPPERPRRSPWPSVAASSPELSGSPPSSPSA